VAAEDTDVAIAIKYDREKDNAPRVIAKGLRLKAEKLREIAKQYNIPVMRNVALANALYRVDVGQEVPEELYDAVAEVLNFVFELKQEHEAGQKK
jgi:flagellar biosynthesis protein